MWVRFPPRLLSHYHQEHGGFHAVIHVDPLKPFGARQKKFGKKRYKVELLLSHQFLIQESESGFWQMSQRLRWFQGWKDSRNIVSRSPKRVITDSVVYSWPWIITTLVPRHPTTSMQPKLTALSVTLQPFNSFLFFALIIYAFEKVAASIPTVLHLCTAYLSNERPGAGRGERGGRREWWAATLLCGNNGAKVN